MIMHSVFMLSGMRKSIQTELDEFFAHLLPPPRHHQIQASGGAIKTAQIHESEAVLIRGSGKFGGLGGWGCGLMYKGTS
jgi:hypothetical protein